MNTLLNNLVDATNYKLTENGAVARKTSKSAIMDLFALGGAYRSRSDADVIFLFKKAFEEDQLLAMKTLFYLADCRGGQGERRFFRVCFRWLANNYPEIAKKNLINIPEYRRYDDLIYSTVDTQIWNDAMAIVKHQLVLDVDCKTPSLLGKWLPSENASSKETKRVANLIREYLDMTHREYRKTRSILRERINVLEKLMSAGQWELIEFDKIPSKAGLVYRNAFSRRDILAKRYEEFAKNKDTKVNAGVLNPVDIAHKAFYSNGLALDNPDRLMLQKYWDNLKDYYNGREENGLCIVDVSGSMSGQPMEAAVSLGAYIAERGHGDFANHFITFSEHPSLVKFEGIDIVDKFNRCRKADWGSCPLRLPAETCREANWGYNTNIERVFDMLLSHIRSGNVKAEDVPTRLYIFSDMEFDRGMSVRSDQVETLLESIARKWRALGYELPQVIFWNLDARNDNIPAIGGRFAYVSGFSPSMVECILSGKDGWDLVLEKILSDRYKAVVA